MSSRVRAWLYHENVDELLSEMEDSLNDLANMGCDKIIIGCNTEHLFLPQIKTENPTTKNRMINIVDRCVDRIIADGISEVFLLATEGTIEAAIYQEKLSRGVRCLTPDRSEYSIVRECIEAVKQNQYSDKQKAHF